MGIKIQWTPRAFLDNLNSTLGSKLDVSAELVSMKAKEEVPVVSGKLRGSITHVTDKDNLIAHIGSNVDYALYVEIGTRKMTPRAYLRKGLSNAWSAVLAIFANKSRRTIERLGKQEIFK